MELEMIICFVSEGMRGMGLFLVPEHLGAEYLPSGR